MRYARPAIGDRQTLYDREIRKLIKQVDIFEWYELYYVKEYLRNNECLSLESQMLENATPLYQILYSKQNIKKMENRLRIYQNENGAEKMQRELDNLKKNLQKYEQLVNRYSGTDVDLFEMQCANPFFEEDIMDMSFAEMDEVWNGEMVQNWWEKFLKQMVLLEIKLGKNPSHREMAEMICEDIYDTVVNHKYKTDEQKKENKRKIKNLTL